MDKTIVSKGAGTRMEITMKERMIVLCVGFLLDLLLGDPHWLWHPVRGMGKGIQWTEKALRNSLKIREERELDKEKKRVSGTILVIIVIILSVGIPALFLYMAWRIHPWLKIVVECVMCYQMLAMKSLKVESMKVYYALKEKNLEKARIKVSMIVGRDTEQLEEEGIIKASIETVAENTSDGVIAPLFYMMLFGVLGGFFYKAVNTMDSMIGYKNDAYCYFGTTAAKLDDVLNFIPARISAICMIIATFFLKLNVKNAIVIFRRDRYQHASPNSAQTEAVCAGALSVQLAGDAYYFGQRYHKPSIGDANRAVETEDIKRANHLMYGTSIVVMAAAMLVFTAI